MVLLHARVLVVHEAALATASVAAGGGKPCLELNLSDLWL